MSLSGASSISTIFPNQSKDLKAISILPERCKHDVSFVRGDRNLSEKWFGHDPAT